MNECMNRKLENSRSRQLVRHPWRPCSSAGIVQPGVLSLRCGVGRKWGSHLDKHWTKLYILGQPWCRLVPLSVSWFSFLFKSYQVLNLFFFLPACILLIHREDLLTFFQVLVLDESLNP